MRRAARTDANQSAIVSAMRSVGASVWVIGSPVDLLVGVAGRTALVEIKTLTGKRAPRPKGYTALQESFMAGANESLVYAYGCGQPTSGLAEALAESALCRKLWDRLVEIDRASERSMQDRACVAVPELARAVSEIIDLKANLAPLYEARAAARQRAKSKARTQYDDRIDELSAQRKVVRSTIWRLIGQWRKDHRDEVREIEVARRAAVINARRESGMYWGNYNRVLDSYDRARSRGLKTGWRPRPSDPEREDGCLAVQIQRTRSGLGAAPGELMSGEVSALSIAIVRPAAYDSATARGDRGRLCKTTVEMRIDAAGSLLRLPLIMHRPLPPACRVKSAQITWRREGVRTRWQLALTVSQPRQELVHQAPFASCGIDIGWRGLVTGALRVGYLSGSDDLARSLELPAEWMAGIDRVEALQSRVDDLDLDARSREAREAVGLRRRLLGQRRERYRLLAREIAMRYATVAVDDADLGHLARAEDRRAGGVRVRAAPSEFVGELARQCCKHGARLLRVEGPSTITCHACGAHTEPLDRSDLIWRCHACGEMWDQDENAARNLLQFAADDASAGVVKAEQPRKINDLRERDPASKRSARNRELDTALSEDIA